MPAPGKFDTLATCQDDSNARKHRNGRKQLQGKKEIEAHIGSASRAERLHDNGAFIAGLILGASTDRRAAILFTAPVQSLFLMIFFLSIGLLIDLSFILENIWVVLLLVFVILVAKTATNIGILHFLRESWDNAGSREVRHARDVSG